MVDEKEFAQMLADPIQFIRICWPEMKLSDKQIEVILSVRDNAETFTHAANKVGKTRIAALTILWWFFSRTPARIVITSSSEAQLRSGLWRELKHLIQTSTLPLPFEVRSLRLEKLTVDASGETEALDYVIGMVPNAPESFQGHHLPSDRPRTLLVVDEASGVADELYDAADSWAHHKLIIGNPLKVHGFFYEGCCSGNQMDAIDNTKLRKKVIHISGLDSPNVKLGMRWKKEGRSGKPPRIIEGLLTYEDFVNHEQKWDDFNRTTRLYGHFYEGDHSRLIPLEWLHLAMDGSRWEALNTQPRTATAMGVDVAAGGRDKTCWTVIDEYGVIEQIVLDLSNTMEIVGRTIELMNQYNLTAWSVVFDAGGGGKQLADRLKEQGHQVRTVWFGEGPDDRQTYKNRRSEIYGALRNILNPESGSEPFLLPPNAEQLRRELLVMPLTYDSEGRLVLPPKNGSADTMTGQKSISQLLGRSPDRADSLVLAVWLLSRQSVSSAYANRVLMCSGGPDDPGNSPLTEEEKEGAPQILRDIWESCDNRDQEDWDDDW